MPGIAVCCLPGEIVNRFEPPLWIESVILAVAPLPMESKATTVATPITIPSIVSAERILFARKARIEFLKFSENKIFPHNVGAG